MTSPVHLVRCKCILVNFGTAGKGGKCYNYTFLFQRKGGGGVYLYKALDMFQWICQILTVFSACCCARFN